MLHRYLKLFAEKFIIFVIPLLTSSLLIDRALATTPPYEHTESKPSDFVIILPWVADRSVSINGNLYGEGDHKGKDTNAIDFTISNGSGGDSTLADRVLAISSGTVVWAGWYNPNGTSTWKCYGNSVAIHHEGSGSRYTSFYTHLSEIDSSIVLGGHVQQGSVVGREGNTGSGLSACITMANHLHFVLYKDADTGTISNSHPPGDAISVMPEPFIGKEVYEGFGLRRYGYKNWPGPLIADDIHPDAVSGSPTGRWKSDATTDATIIATDQSVRFAIEKLPFDTKEVRFTTYYHHIKDNYDQGWSVMDNATDQAVWRILARCWPDSQQTKCHWSDNNSVLSYEWVPHLDDFGSVAPWLPSGQDLYPAFNEDSKNNEVCISFDIFDQAGNVSYAPDQTKCLPKGGGGIGQSSSIFLPLIIQGSMHGSESAARSGSAKPTPFSINNTPIIDDNSVRVIYIAPSNIPVHPPGPGLPADSWYVDYFKDLNLNGSACNSSTISLFDNPPQQTFVFKDWGDNAPYQDCKGDFSARIWRRIHLDGGTFNFHLFADDKARLYLDGNLVVDQWAGTAHNESRTITSGDHDLKIEFQDSGGAAWVNLWWDGPGYPAPPHETKDPNQWFVAFWQGTEWHGDAFITYNDGNPLPLDKAWGSGGPGYGLPNDNFSSIYERTYDFACGEYRFHLDADDYAELQIVDPDTNVRQFEPLVVTVANNPVQNPSAVHLAGKKYVVTVKHKEYGGDARLYVNWTLETPCATPVPLGSPNLISPANDVPLTNHQPTFSWQAVTGAGRYHFQLDNNIDFSSPEREQITQRILITSTISMSDGEYYWRVRSELDAVSVSAWSPVWHFTIVTPPTCITPSIPILTSPDANSKINVNRPTFSWSSVNGANQYQIQIDNNIELSSPEQDSLVSSIKYQPVAALNNNTYYWHVRGLNTANGCNLMSAWSELWAVTINAQPTCDTISEIPQAECRALEALYNSTDQVGETDNWFTTYSPCSSWAGIECGGGHVTALRLDDFYIHGTIPSELGNLTQLQVLDLADNFALTGSIPSTLGNLTQLKTLHLDRNALNGMVPPELGNLANLQELTLYTNQLSGSLPANLTNLLQLKLLYFNDTNLCEPGESSFQTWLGRIPDLQRTNAVCGIPVNTFQLNVGFQARNNLAGLPQNVPVKVKIKDPTGSQVLVETGWLSVTPAPDGNDWGATSVDVVGVGLLPGQPYQIFVTGAMHLSRRAITQLYDGTIVNFTQWHPNGANILNACDINQDNQITQADVNIWLSYSHAGGEPPAQPDPFSEIYRTDQNGDRVIDIDDFGICKYNLGLLGD